MNSISSTKIYTLFHNIFIKISFQLRLNIYFFIDKKNATFKREEPSLHIHKSNNALAEQALYMYGDSILRLAYSYLHNLFDAEDVLQETLIQMILKAPTFKSTEHQKAWLLRVAINISKNKLKYNRHRQHTELQQSISDEVPENLTFVWGAVATLPVKYREVIHLFYQEGLSTAEIATLLSKQDSTIRSLLYRARGLLKEQLKELFDFE